MEGDLPGSDAQMRMAPVRAEAPERLQVEGRDCREAGVLALLTPRDDEPHLVVTVRRAHLPDHAGQVSFPGGGREHDEDLIETALREAEEEVMLDPEHVELLGELTPLYIPPSNFCVYPFLGFTQGEVHLQPDDFEVAEIVLLPLQELLAKDTIRREVWTIRDEELVVPYFDIAGLTLWGATAMMVAEIVALFD